MRILSRIWQSSLARQFATLLSGRFVAAGIQAASIYLLARWSKVEDFGLVSSALGVSVTLQAIGDAGATMFIVRETAAHGVNRKVAYAELMSRIVIAGVVAFSVAVVLVLTFATDAKYIALLPLSLWIALDRSSDIRSAIARGLGDVRMGTINLVSRRTAQLVLFVAAFHAGIQIMWAYSLTLLAGSALVLLVMWRKLPRPPVVPLRVRPIGIAFGRCRPYWVHSAANQLRNLDAAVVATISGPVQAAFYGVGARLMTPLRMVPDALATALLPHLVRQGGPRRKDMSIGLLIAVAMSLPYIALVAVAPFVTRHLGSQFEGATFPLQIMCLGLAGASFIAIFTAILQARKQAGLVARISVLSAVLLLILVMLGTILHGAAGAAIGFTAAIFIQAALVFRGANSPHTATP